MQNPPHRNDTSTILQTKQMNSKTMASKAATILQTNAVHPPRVQEELGERHVTRSFTPRKTALSQPQNKISKIPLATFLGLT